jgi:hypothetical protein
MELPDPCLWTIFNSPCQLSTDAGDVELRILRIDPIALPSGRIVLGDPIVDICYNKPLMQSVPPGRYSVRLATATGLNGIIASLVRFLVATPVRWEPTDPDSHGVDSGTSGLIDFELACRVRKKSSEWSERHRNRCLDALESSDEPWSNRRLDRETGANLLFFSTATGDGTYRSFCGYSASDDLVCVVTDFFLERRVRGVIVAESK